MHLKLVYFTTNCLFVISPFLKVNRRMYMDAAKWLCQEVTLLIAKCMKKSIEMYDRKTAILLLPELGLSLGCLMDLEKPNFLFEDMLLRWIWYHAYFLCPLKSTASHPLICRCSSDCVTSPLYYKLELIYCCFSKAVNKKRGAIFMTPQCI